MPSGIISVPNTAAHLRTSMTLGELLDVIAFPAGAGGQPDKVRALRAFNMALDWLVNSAEWNYYHVQNASGTTTAGTATYTVPTRVRSIYSIKVPSGNPRPIRPIHQDEYDRKVYDQTSNSTFMWYHVQAKDQSSVITFLPTPDAAESFTVDYFRDPEKITDRAGNPDLATWMEEPVILRAQGLIALWAGRPDNRTFLQLAEQALTRALERDHNSHDDQEGFKKVDDGDTFWPWDHPNREDW